MGGMSLIFTPVLVRCLLGPPGLSRPMTNGSCLIATPTVQLEGITSLWLPTCPHHPLSPPARRPLIRAIHDITVVVKKLLKIQQC